MTPSRPLSGEGTGRRPVAALRVIVTTAGLTFSTADVMADDSATPTTRPARRWSRWMAGPAVPDDRDRAGRSAQQQRVRASERRRRRPAARDERAREVEPRRTTAVASRPGWAPSRRDGCWIHRIGRGAAVAAGAAGRRPRRSRLRRRAVRSRGRPPWSSVGPVGHGAESSGAGARRLWHHGALPPSLAAKIQGRGGWLKNRHAARCATCSRAA